MYSSYATAAAVCSVIFPVLATAAVGLRLRARRLNALSYGLDDYFVLAALCFATVEGCIVLYGACQAGIGQQLSTMSLEQFTNYQKHLYFDVIVAHLAIGIIKISVLLFYKRIFSTKSFYLWANVTLGVVVLWILGSFFTQIFSAWPISDWWTQKAGYNMNYGAFLTAFAAMDIALDLVILLLPLPVIKNLNMSRRRKMTLIGIFWLGAFCVVSASVRLYFAYELTSGTDQHPTDDRFSYISVNNVIWSLIEPCVSIIAACLPTFGPLVKTGFSFKMSARGTYSYLLKHTPFVSSKQDSTHSIKVGDWPQPPQRVNIDDSWTSIGDGSDGRGYKVDVEMGGSNETNGLVPADGRGEAGRLPFDNDTDGRLTQPSEIHVEKTFASSTERRW